MPPWTDGTHLYQDEVNRQLAALDQARQRRHMAWQHVEDTRPRETCVATYAANADEAQVICVLRLEGVGERRAKEYVNSAKVCSLVDECLGQRLRFTGSVTPEDRVAGPNERGKIKRHAGAARGALSSHLRPVVTPDSLHRNSHPGRPAEQDS
jgi:hypothetical protein